ncbi:hypothetical protein BASA81_003593 [Batrachochytrium salamandrivorans]|nr:hypothetical protein BASA81_003593 [Batrachochytrium salamandrivorans]
MGIPRFYRWLSERYPQINQRLDENVGQLLPQFDNMYLDANGIIHNCSHPNDDSPASAVHLSLEEMATQMCAYIDRMVQLIRPERVLFIAIDGCAPRAKMNQQRCRRFATARDAALAQTGLTPEEVDQLFDSNQITPGTQFMADLTEYFEFFFRFKIKSDPLYSKLQVVFSGNNVPGEGEHKIMDYIRNVCDVNTRHCLVGLDADLICLALASHMPHFSLLREAVNFQAFRQTQKQNATKEVVKQITQSKFELLRVSTLREYIALEYQHVSSEAARVLDDWVLMIMLVGNDFLPPLPSMDIFEGGLDSMLEVHKQMLSQTSGKGFLVDSVQGKKQINFDRLEALFRQLGAMEEKVFADREVRVAHERKQHVTHSNVSLEAAEVEEEMDSSSVETPPTGEEGEMEDAFVVAQRQESRKRRTRYYTQKFGACEEELITQVVNRYVQGLNWVFQYYYFGVPSWNWFFPFHYSPLCSDLKNLPRQAHEFEMGQPFPPFCQLLACLPANSSKFLPKPFQNLMIQEHSPLAEFYPKTWLVDENGKRNPWEFVNLLPFIDEQALFTAVANLDLSKLTESELKRNTFGEAYVYELDLANLQEVVRSPFQVHYNQTLAPALSSKRVFNIPIKGVGASFAEGQAKVLVSDSCLHFHRGLIPGQCMLRHIKLNTFGSPSQKATLVLRLDAAIGDITLEQFVTNRLSNPTCWINYPHLNEARIIQVIDIKQRRGYCFETQKWLSRVENCDELKAEVDVMTSQSKVGAKVAGTGGMDFGALSYLTLRVKTLGEIREDANTGRFEKKYSTMDFLVPIEMVVLDVEDDGSDLRFRQEEGSEGVVSLDVRFPQGVEVVCVGERGYGMLGKVVGVDQESVQVEFPQFVRPGNEFARSLADSLQDKYFGLSEMAKRTNLPVSVVDKFLGSVKVWNVSKAKGKPQAVDFGLNLRVGKGFTVPGYARFVGGGVNVVEAWKSGDSVVRISSASVASKGEFTDTRNAQGNLFEYSVAALELLLLYQSKFPALFQRVVNARNLSSPDFQRKDLFGGAQDQTPELILTWLRQIPSYSVPLVPISSTQMSKAAVDAIDVATRELKHSTSAGPAQGATTVIVSVLPHLLRKNPKFNRGQMLSPTSLITPPLLGDRVLNLTNVLIPFGLAGVVVATHPSSGAVQVVFEDTFVGGTTLSGLCKAGQGALLPYIQVLNLTQRGVVDVDPNAPLPSNMVLPPSREELRQLQLKALANRQPQSKATPVKPAAAKPQQPNLTWNAPPPAKQRAPKPSPVVVPPPASKQNPATTSAKKAATPKQTFAPKPPAAAAATAASTAAVSTPASGEDPNDLADYFLRLMSAPSPAPAAPAAAALAAPTAAAAAPAKESSAATLARVEALFKRAQEQGSNKHDTD